MADPQSKTFNELDVELWPRVSWSPSFAITFADLKVCTPVQSLPGLPELPDLQFEPKAPAIIPRSCLEIHARPSKVLSGSKLQGVTWKEAADMTVGHSDCKSLTREAGTVSLLTFVTTVSTRVSKQGKHISHESKHSSSCTRDPC